MYNTLRNTTNSFIPLGSNIQFSTNTEKEQVIIKKEMKCDTRIHR
jgi:hypothetical protein